MLARLRLLRKSSRQMHRLDHQQRRALVARLRRLPRTQVKILPLPSTASGPSASCSAHTSSNAFRVIGRKLPLRRIVAGEDHHVQHSFRSRADSAAFPFPYFSSE